MKQKTKNPPARFKEDNSVLLAKIKGVELRLTTLNKLFVIHGKQIAWPYLRGEEVCFDVVDMTSENMLPKAVEKIRSILKKKAEIREKHMLDFDEDEAVYTFN